MKIALLGGNSYQYAFKPSYAQANGKGYITGDELLGAAAATTITKQDALDTVAYYKSIGAEKEIPLDILAIAQGPDDGSTKTEKATNVLGFISNIFEKGAGIVSDITGAKNTSAQTSAQQQALLTQQSKDNTALIVTGAVAGVALLAVVMSKKPSRRR